MHVGASARRIGSVVAGLIVVVLIILAVQAVSGALYPAPPDLDFTDREAAASHVWQLPNGALLIVALSYLLGSLAAGVVLTLAGFMNLAAIPQSVWFAVLTTVTYVPGAWLGVRLARGRMPGEQECTIGPVSMTFVSRPGTEMRRSSGFTDGPRLAFHPDH